MSFEKISGGDKDYAPTKWVRWTEHDEPKENHLVVKKGQSVEGYYLKQRDSEYNGKPQTNFILVNKEGVQLQLPVAKDITRAFQSSNIIKGALTRLTYLGKEAFEGKDANGNPVQARATKVLVEQNKADMTGFSGEPGCEVLAPVGTEPTPAITPTAEPAVTTSTITSADVPF